MTDKLSLDPGVIRAVAHGGAFFFLGAGFSCAAGMSSTAKLCRLLRDGIEAESHKHKASARELEEIAASDLQRTCGVYDRYFEDGASNRLICRTLKEDAKSADTSFAGLLADMPVSRIVTTNYDDLVETAFGADIDVWHCEEHARSRTIDDKQPLLIKVHGTVDEPEKIVLKRDDYDLFEERNPLLVNLIETLFITKMPFLLGWSMEDQNFRTIIKRLHETKGLKKVIYAVQSEVNPQAKSDLQRYGVEFIQADLREFLPLLAEGVRSYVKTEYKLRRVSQVTSESQLQADHNPFRFYQADKIAVEDVDIIRNHFIPIPEYAKVVSPASNTIIEGHRGSGKTMLLRYLAIQVQLAENGAASIPFAGIYIKFGTKYFNSVACRGNGDTDDRRWVDHFAHVLNLALALNTVKTLDLLSRLQLASFERGKVSTFCADLIEDIMHCEWLRRHKSPTFANAARAIQSSFNVSRSTQHDPGTYLLPLDFPYQLVELLRDLHEIFRAKQIFFLLDDLDSLSIPQWQVLNLFLKERDDPVTYKVTVSHDRWPREDPNGTLMKFEDDYNVVFTDQYTKEDRDAYFGFLKDIANRSLEQSRSGITEVSKLLMQRKAKSVKEKLRLIGREFSGVRRYSYLSSGIVRVFVSLLKDTVSEAYPDIARAPVQIKPIPFQVQNNVVLRKSAIHRSANENTPNPDAVLKLIDSLARMFREELESSRKNSESLLSRGEAYNTDCLRTVSQFQIVNRGGLSKDIAELLERAVDASLLQRPFRPRQPQQRRRIPHLNYKLHRMLVPYYELSLANRHPRALDASVLNDILKMSEDDFAKAALKTYPLFQETPTTPEEHETQQELEFDYADDDDL